MKKRFRLISRIGLAVLLLSGCTNNEIGVTEYNASPNVTIASPEPSEEIQPESMEAIPEVVEESLSSELVSESSSEATLAETEEEEVESVGEPEPAIEAQNFTHYDVQNETIEDKRIQQGLLKAIAFLKVNHQFFDTAEYHFEVSEGPEADTFIIEVNQRRSDGLDTIGRYAYNYEAKTLDPFYK